MPRTHNMKNVPLEDLVAFLRHLERTITPDDYIDCDPAGVRIVGATHRWPLLAEVAGGLDAALTKILGARPVYMTVQHVEMGPTPFVGVTVYVAPSVLRRLIADEGQSLPALTLAAEENQDEVCVWFHEVHRSVDDNVARPF